MMKNTKKISLIITFALMFAIMIMGSVALTIDAPSSGATVSGTTNFSVTTVIPNVRNCTFSTTADTNFVIVTNTSGDQSVFSNQFATGSLTDGATTLSINCTNATIGELATLSITVDNTNPTANLELDPEVVIIFHEVEADCSRSTDAIDTSLSFQIQLIDPESIAVGSNKTTSIAQFDNGEIEQFGEYTIRCCVTDNGDNTNCQALTFDTRSSDDSKVAATFAASQTKTGIIIAGIFLLVVAAVIGVIITSKSSKKRK